MARRRRWRERALLLAPLLAFGSVLLTVWALVGWYVIQKPDELRAQQRRDLADGVRAVALQTEPVLRQAESGLKAVDLWLLNRPDDLTLAEPVLDKFAENVRGSSRHLVDIVLVAGGTGQVRRLQAQAPREVLSIAGTPALDLLAGLGPGGLALGQPLRLEGSGGDTRLRLPLMMRLSRPVGEYGVALALIDLGRLQDAQSLFMQVPDASLVLLRTDGLALARRPEVPGFVGRNLFDQFPAARQDLSGAEGFFASTGAATDGRPRIGAFVTLTDFSLKLLLSATDDAALRPYQQQRTLVLAAALALTLALLLLGRWLHQLQRAARLREAMLQATSNALPLGLFRTDASGRIVDVNETYLTVHGLRREDIEWGWSTLVQPEQRDMLIQRWKHLMAAGEPIDMVRKMKRGDDGRIRWIAVRSQPLLIDGQVAGQVGTVEDVTERGEQERARQTLTAIFDMTPDFVCQANEQGHITYLNPAARARLGLTPTASLEDARISDYFTAEQLTRYQNDVLPAALRDGHWRGRIAVQLASGWAPMDCLVIVHRDVRGRVETISVVLRDMADQLRAQQERERSEAMLLAVAHTARAQFLVGDTEGRVIFFNAAFGRQRNVVLADWQGRPLAELFGPRAHAQRAPLIASALAGESRRMELAEPGERDGTRFDVQYAPLRVQSGKIEGVIAIEVDVTEARREEARLRLASQTDALTQLLNRSGFEEGARRQLAGTTGQRLGLLYLDLDRFKPVNDQHGHPTGDALLKAIALRLRHALRPADLVARLGGDEFAVLLPQLHDAADAAAVAAKLMQVLSAPYHIGELELEIGVSIGYCVATTGALTLEQLVAEADRHLYEVKRAGRGRWAGAELAPDG